MAKKMLIDATHPEETRVVVVDGNQVEEFDFETLSRRQLAGNIYLAKVTRVEPSLQAAFVDYGGNRHGFLAFAEIHPDYYQIPVADRQALLAEERAISDAEDEDAETERPQRRSRRPRTRHQAESVNKAQDSVVTGDMVPRDGGADLFVAPMGMDIVDADNAAPDYLPLNFSIATPEALIAPQDDSLDETPAAEDDGSSDIDNQMPADEPVLGAEMPIESMGAEDISEEIRPQRKPRHRRYKIQEVIKMRQIMLVQVVKEERGNKGAALTTYLSLAGRYCVLMPNTARGGGISRKITNIADRKKLKEIAQEIEVPEGAGLIIRTAGAKRTKPEIKRDCEYLMRLWEQVRELTLRSIAPAQIYEEGNLIKRSIRDLYNREIEEVLVEGAEGYRVAKDFMRMIMPSHSKAVQPYTDPTPLFARYQVESYLAGMFNPVVQLKSGGYIVIGVTEALVAIDINSGRATKEGSIEDTALRTNLEAADEIARQLRLRDLAGLIVIDFIDMDERRNNAAVEKRIKDRLKSDRARIQVGGISGFGLLEMSRQRLHPGMLESTTQPCPHCHGTGLIRSDDSMALTILRALEEEGTRGRSREVLLKAPLAVVNYLFNAKREHISLIESRYNMAVRIEGDPALISPDYTIEKFKIATRVVSSASLTNSHVVSGDASIMPEIEPELESDEAEIIAESTDIVSSEEQANGKKKRRRRRRRKGGNPLGDLAQGEQNDADDGSEDEGEDEVALPPAEDDLMSAAPQETPLKPKRTRRKKVEAASDDAPPPEAEAVVKAPRKRTRKKPLVAVEASPTQFMAPTAETQAVVHEAIMPEVFAEQQLQEQDPQEDKPKRRGWWSLGRK